MRPIHLAPVVLLLVVAGCGSSGKLDESTPSTTTPTKTAAAAPTPTPTATAEDDLKKTISDYSRAYLTGDGETAYELLSQRCQGVLPLSQFASLTEQAKDLYGDVRIETVDVTVDGEKATTTYTYAVPAIDQTNEPWVHEGTGWKNDDC